MMKSAAAALALLGLLAAAPAEATTILGFDGPCKAWFKEGDKNADPSKETPIPSDFALGGGGSG